MGGLISESTLTKIAAQLLFIVVALYPQLLFGQTAPTANFSADVVSGCSPLVVKFTDLSTNSPAAWAWDLGVSTSSAQNPTATFIAPGTYTIKLTATNNSGSGSTTKAGYITIYAPPSVDFVTKDTVGCVVLLSKFTDLSNTESGAISKWEWNFGDGSTSTRQNPTNEYKNTGTYSVFLKVTNSFGCSKTGVKSQYIKAYPFVKSSFNNSIPTYCRFPVNVSFTNGNASNSGVNYQWSFGDGSTSTQTNPIHPFVAGGNYTVTLISKNEFGCTDTLTKNVNLPAKATNYTVTAPLCVGTAATFISTTTPAPVSVKWQMGDGSTYNTSAVTHSYTAAGSYTVRLISDFGDCIDSVSKTFSVYETPKVDFSAPATASCKAPFTVSFSAISEGASEWKWKFGDGAVSNVQNPVYTYKTNGLFDVLLTAVNVNGCSTTLNKKGLISIIPPALKITNLPVYDCPPYTFTPAYSISSADNVTSYFWTFGDGSSSTEQFPKHTYPSLGSYSIFFKVSTLNGCSDSIYMPNTVNIGERTTVDFSVSATDVCGGSINFAPTTGITPDFYVWDFGDNTPLDRQTNPNTTHRYSDTGIYTVELLVNKGGCNSTVIKHNVVKVKGPIVEFSFTKDCVEKGKVSFTNNTTFGTNYKWNFGDGATSVEPNPVHYYKTGKNYMVSLIVSNETCADTLSKTVPVWFVKPDVTVNENIICKGDRSIFTIGHPNPGAVTFYNWNLTGNLNDEFITTSNNFIGWDYNKAGNYRFSAYTVDSFGCRDTIIKPDYIRVNGSNANFGAITTSGCLGNTFNFIDSSITDGVNALKSWSWHYGDGIPVTYTNPPFNHNYSAVGKHDVTLKVTDQSGCTDSITKPSFINVDLGKAAFTSIDSFSCSGSTVSFLNESLGNIIRHNWHFGDGNTSTLANPVHSYSTPGTYSVRLVVDVSAGCSDSIVKQDFIVINNPSAKFGVSDTLGSCPPSEIKFFDSSNYVQAWKWTFDDGNTSSSPNPVNVFLNPGTYTVQLVATSYGGCVDSASKKVIIAGPTGQLSYNTISGCAPTTVTLKVNNIIGALNYSWDFGDGVTYSSNDSSSVHTYTSAGKYLPRVLMKDDKDCVVPYVGRDTIFIEKLEPAFTADNRLLCDSGTVSFVDSTTSIKPYKRTWFLGDGTISNVANPVHKYTAPGKYTVKLLVQSSIGCVDSLQYPNLITVVKSPVVSISSKDSICNGSASFSFLITPDTSDIKTYLWNFGNGNTSTSKTPPEQSFVPGTYNNSFIVTTADGCTATTSKPLIIIDLPKVYAGADTTICRGDLASMNATGAETYTWTALNNNSSLSCKNCKSTVVTGITNALFAVKGTNNNTCSNYDTVMVYVMQPYRLTVESSVSVCKGSSLQLKAAGAPNYMWYPAAGLNAVNISNPVASPTVNTIYRVVGYDSLGCFTDTATVNAAVYNIPSVNAGKDLSIPVGSTVTLNAIASSDVVSYRWTPATDVSCADCASPVLTARDNRLYRVRVANDGGCTAEDSVRVSVTCTDASIYLPNTFSPNGDGMNDIFYPRGNGIYNISSLRIFNRWGELVFFKRNFSANDPSAGWNGTYNKKRATGGVYIYTIELICTSNQAIQLSGTINLLQ